ncbi:DUF1778 domain-containing protein [Sphingobium sp. AS12]|uniref:type II toxin-antitoxin system TacA family antitoxin n=1 Tax=Sphingobium sp. AS12 TaxID=2849495 RepID=UPI001C31BBC3|nr:DUF1778 domain-containing protein [Sphingobium sp. AS12]MBV2149967.1 DUF1778 domain-containing protein [Sphingobium sp. AS12]
MNVTAVRKETPVSMRFRNDDLAIIDRGAASVGLSRTEFVRRAALHDAQLAMLNERVVRVSDETFTEFLAAIDAPVKPLPPKAQERLTRKAPWA